MFGQLRVSSFSYMDPMFFGGIALDTHVKSRKQKNTTQFMGPGWCLSNVLDIDVR